MQERPRGQKNPSQQGKGLRILLGTISLSRLTEVDTLPAHPASHACSQLVALQFIFGGGVSTVARLAK
jgi:hypothetical protein